MRPLVIALVVMVSAVAAGTAGLIAFQLAKADPAKADPTKPDPARRPDDPPPATKPAAKPTEPAKPDPDAPDKGTKAEGLPPLPTLGDKSKHTPLNKEKTLYLEEAEGGEKRVLFAAEVILREGVLLEVFCCKKQTKEHESILNVDLDARFLHAALLMAGAKAGKPVQFVNPKTHEAEYKAASGQRIEVEVNYTQDGKAKQERAQEWLLDQKTRKPLPYEWVFAGSRFVKNPDRPNDPEYYLANNGEVIAVSNFTDSMLDLPVEISRDEADLHFKAAYKKIPAGRVEGVGDPHPGGGEEGRQEVAPLGRRTGNAVTGWVRSPGHGVPGSPFPPAPPAVSSASLRGVRMSAVATPVQAATYMADAAIARFSVARYLRMTEQGILSADDKVELLENNVVLKMPRNPPHDGTIQFITDMLRPHLPAGWGFRILLAVVLPDSVPEPDICLARGDARTYLTRHPTAADCGLVIEVADSSLLRDQRDKTRIYARAGIVCYWIVNLPDRRVEVYSQPSGPTAAPQYGAFATFQPGDAIPLTLDAATVSIPAADLLP